MRHEGVGWLDFDCLFRQQAAITPNLQWNVIHPELHVTTILGQRPAVSGTFCTLCQECDHTSAQCCIDPASADGDEKHPVYLNSTNYSLLGKSVDIVE